MANATISVRDGSPSMSAQLSTTTRPVSVPTLRSIRPAVDDEGLPDGENAEHGGLPADIGEVLRIGEIGHEQGRRQTRATARSAQMPWRSKSNRQPLSAMVTATGPAIFASSRLDLRHKHTLACQTWGSYAGEVNKYQLIGWMMAAMEKDKRSKRTSDGKKPCRAAGRGARRLCRSRAFRRPCR